MDTTGNSILFYVDGPFIADYSPLNVLPGSVTDGLAPAGRQTDSSQPASFGKFRFPSTYYYIHVDLHLVVAVAAAVGIPGYTSMVLVLQLYSCRKGLGENPNKTLPTYY